MKRIVLFLVTNIAIMLMLSITLSLLGVRSYMSEAGINYQSLLIFTAVMGMGGSFISLAISKWTAKRMVGAAVIKEPTTLEEKWLLETVHAQAKSAGIGMPEVAIYNSPDVNAFATGMNKNNALVAVSNGLLKAMSRDEAEAVLAHEVTHIANGDMVTLALIQGVVNTFVMFLSRVIGYTVDKVVFKTERGQGTAFYITMIIAELLLGILASIIVMWFSRQREFRADLGGASLAGRQKMIAALEKLKLGQANMQTEAQLPTKIATFGISGAQKMGLRRLFMTHPPLEERITMLKQTA
ncbi:MAG: protease HtpX [Methylophilaceae bacterium]